MASGSFKLLVVVACLAALSSNVMGDQLASRRLLNKWGSQPSWQPQPTQKPQQQPQKPPTSVNQGQVANNDGGNDSGNKGFLAGGVGSGDAILSNNGDSAQQVGGNSQNSGNNGGVLNGVLPAALGRHLLNNNKWGSQPSNPSWQPQKPPQQTQKPSTQPSSVNQGQIANNDGGNDSGNKGTLAGGVLSGDSVLSNNGDSAQQVGGNSQNSGNNGGVLNGVLPAALGRHLLNNKWGSQPSNPSWQPQQTQKPPQQTQKPSTQPSSVNQGQIANNDGGNDSGNKGILAGGVLSGDSFLSNNGDSAQQTGGNSVGSGNNGGVLNGVLPTGRHLLNGFSWPVPNPKPGSVNQGQVANNNGGNDANNRGFVAGGLLSGDQIVSNNGNNAQQVGGNSQDSGNNGGFLNAAPKTTTPTNPGTTKPSR